jgi:glycerol-3-phosphate acyltransferase PlsY
MMEGFLFVVVGYLSGSIPFSYLMGRLVGGKDVRREGSGNVGATNVFRVAGRRAGIAAATGDLLKSFLPVLAARMAGMDPLWIALTGGAVIIGHCYPVWLGFSGGKGVNSALAVFLVIFWPAVLVFGVVWLSCFRLTGYVSLASIIGAATLPVTLHVGGRTGEYTFLAALTALFIAYRHRSNIRRLLEGTESRMGRLSSGDPPDRGGARPDPS